MLAQKYSQADLVDLGIEKTASYSRSVQQGRLNALRVDTYKNICETLMDHCIKQNIVTRQEEVDRLIRLQKLWEELNDLLKVCSSTSETVRICRSCVETSTVFN